jgi:hypothetical protein
VTETYECAMCRKVFETVTSHEEALAEMEFYFGPVPEEERDIICDECYKKINPAEHPEIVALVRKSLGND